MSVRYDIPNYPGYFLEEDGEEFRIIGKRGKPLSMIEISSGYLYCNGILVHRAIALVKHADTWFEGAVVDHIDRNKRNNHPSNLRWMTQKENVGRSETVGAPKGRKPWNIGIPHSEETKAKLSENHADVSGKNNPIFGKPRTKETKARISAGRAGKHWYNNGIQEIFVVVQPLGFVSGRLTKKDKECLKLLGS